MIKKISIAIFLSLLVAGCATVPRFDRVNTFSIDGYRYVALNDFCKVHDIGWQWDSFASVLTLNKGLDVANILVGSKTAQINGQNETFSAPFRFYRGEIIVPLDFKQRFAKQWIKAALSITEETFPRFGYKIKRVVIDPGHGGKDPGAISRSGIKEKQMTLDIAKRLKIVLESKGIDVVLTRSSDGFISLVRRTEIANKAGADLFISIHVNSNRSKQPHGFETYYFSEASDSAARALAVAENASYIYEVSAGNSSRNLKAILGDMISTENTAASKELARYVCDNTCRILGIRNRGIKSAHFVVLAKSDIPAILVEVGFLSNLKEERYLTNSFYRQQIAEGLANSVSSYTRLYRLTEK